MKTAGGDVSRDFATDGTIMNATGGTVTTAEGAGKGSYAPVVAKPFTYKELDKGYTKP